MSPKKHSRSYFSIKAKQQNPGVIPVFSPESWSERRLKWYTADELIAKRHHILHIRQTIQKPSILRKIDHELFTIKSILS